MSEITSQCTSLAKQLTDFAGLLEEGQADSALQQYGRKLQCSVGYNTVALNVLSLGHGTLADFLRYIGMHDEVQAAFLEDIDTGYVLDMTTDQRALVTTGGTSTFSDWKSLQEVVKTGRQDLLEIHVPAPDGLVPLRLNILDRQALILLDVSAVNSMANHAAALAVIGREHYTLTAEERGAYAQAASNTTYLWPIILPARDSEPTDQGWLQEAVPGHVKIIPSWRPVNTEVLPAMLSCTPSAEADVLHAMISLQRVRRYADLLDHGMRDKADSADFQLQANEVLQEIAKDTSDFDDSIQGYKKSLSVLRDRVSSLQKSLQTRSRHNLAGQHIYPQLVDSVLDSLKQGDLTRKQEHKSYRLELSESAITGIKEGVWKNITQRHTDETDEYLEGIRRAVEQCGLTGQAFMQSLMRKLDDDETRLFVIDPLKTLLDFKARYKGEMQKRGFLKRLGEGRRVVFMVLMIFSIGGSMAGFNYREYSMIGFMFLLIFFGASIFTFISWKKDDQYQLGKEIEKARDQIRMDVLRSITDVERERLNYFTEWFQESFQDLQRDFEDWRVTVQKNEKGRVDQSRRMSKSKDEKLQGMIRVMDKTRQDIAGIRQHLDRLDSQQSIAAEAAGFR